MSHTLSTPKGTLAVRPAVQEDAFWLRELRLEALTNQPQSFTADFTIAAAEPVESWAERVANFETDQQGVICVAAAEKRLIGMLGLIRGNRPKTQHTGTVWGVYVQADWRGLHVAEAMVREAIAWAQARGLVRLKLEVITTNAAAIRSYVRCGFTVYGVEPEVIFYDDIYYDELLMTRPV